MSPRRGRTEEFTSYYGRPILKEPTWQALDIAGYIFAGGLAGASSILGAGAQHTDRPGLERSAKLTALAAISASVVALVHDLGRPERFVNMLRVAKPTSPMSVGSWILSAYGPLAGATAAANVLGIFPRAGKAAGIGAGITGSAVATYTAVLLADTAVPAWHDAHERLPFVFASSAAASAGGLAAALAPIAQGQPARRMAIGGAAAEIALSVAVERSGNLSAETLHEGRAGVLLRLSKAFTVGGAVGLALGGRSSRVVSTLSGLAVAAGSALLRFGLFEAGRASTRDPKYVVVPQRERLAARQEAAVGADTMG
ncbi:NrfD/PsrC family molybdoenzyme membrane anchor subunit [Sinomonas sp. ASV486]|uniref:NrfD/PsrC family molybdoenzyme membrane anchor subunit n=1 Tax=Sinomonas sp. ASV486 TaxID=3051170 RepID=UPI0027DE59FB|nr:NrfD/PsrC family molybdoenzyme membrane anchor subunit [Sinomonas sp. ASV486]MDQ4489563.1 NrfD/PsrC family molybdoenzyme membrane anchor subunit [Sinomonas sp. ASV486]